MKKHTLFHLAWTALLGAICAVSCQTVKEADLAGERLTYDLTVVADLAETRTANDGNSTVWVADDALTVLHIEEGGTTYYPSRFYFSGENNAFKGRVSDVADYNNWYMIYPYREENVSAEDIHITVFPELVQTGNSSKAHLAGEGFPLYGKAIGMPRSASLNVYMSNALAVMNYKVTNTTDSPIAAPQSISGNFTGDLTNDNVEWEPAGTTSSNVTVRVVEGEEIAAGENASFYAGAIPFSVAPGGQLKVKVTAVHPSDPDQEIEFYHVYDLPNGTTFSPSSIKTLNLNFDENHQTDPGSDTPAIKQDQTLTFANEAITWTLGDTYAVGGVYDLPQEVAGAKTAVTYTSSKSEVATISDGKVRIAGTGTTTILAVAAEDDSYNAAEASYTLTIAEAAVTPTERTYAYQSSTITEGTYLIAGYESQGTYICLFPKKSDNLCDHLLFSSDSGLTTITTEDTDIIGSEVEITASGSNWLVRVKDNGQYMYYANGGISFTSDASVATQSISKTSSGNRYWVMKNTVSNTSYEFYHSGSNAGFLYSSNKGANNLKFFKLDSSKQTQDISFANPTVTWTLGDVYQVGSTYSLPQVSGAQTTVTYTSSNTSVAEVVNGNQVKINAAGTTTITATAAETATYLGAIATMTLEIKNGSTPVTGSAYVEVTSEPESWDGTYLFVDKTAGKAFAAFSANASSYAVDVTIVDDRIEATSDIAKYALTVTGAGVTHANASGQAAYNVQNSDGKYIFYSSSTLQIADTNTKTSSYSSSATTYYHAFKYDNGVQVLSSGHSSGYNKYYLGYSSNAFGYSSGSDTRRIQLYKLDGEGGTTPVDPQPGTNPTYTKANAITAGGTYLITSVADDQLFKGNADGTAVSVSPVGGVITDTDNTLSAYEFTVEQSGSNYYLKFNDGKYLVCDYTNGDGTTGLRYVNAQSNVTYPYRLTVNNGAFEFNTTQMNSSSTTNQVLYYKTASMSGSGQNRFKIGGSGVGVGVHLYQKNGGGSTPTPAKQDQTLTFAQSNVNWTLGSGYTVGGSYAVQTVSGAQTAVTYTSSNTNVATIVNGQISIVAAGTTTIVATAAASSSYNAATASYTLTIVAAPATGNAYVKVDALIAGATYVITSVADDQLFKGNVDGSAVSVSPAGGVISDTNNTLSAYEFTVEQSGSNYYLRFNDGKYLVCDYTNGDGTTGLRYVNAQSNVTYPYRLTVNNGAFEFNTTQMNSSSTTNQVLYYKTASMSGSGQNRFKIGGSGVGVGVHLYQKNGGGSTPTPAKQDQTLTFAQSNVNWTLGSGYTVGGSYAVQTVSGAQTAVTYSSSNTGVATISGTQVRIVGSGMTTITATAPGNDNYYAGSASYTLTIIPASGAMTYSIENASVEEYFNYVEQHPYDPSDYSYSYVTNYSNGTGQNNRLDWPKPVPVSWSNPTSGNGSKVVYIYNDAAMTSEELSVSVSSSSATSADVYNLIPGRTYYYKVTNNGNTLSTGQFNTTGRRRMIKVGDSRYGQSYANNCRDLGGQVATNGKKIKFGILYRGSNMDSITEEARNCLLNYMKIELDVDLRESTGRNPLGISVSDQTYNSMNDLTNRNKMGNTLRDIINAVHSGKHAYIHCAVGADRTGFVCMVLEGLLGIPQNMCDVDYELTSFAGAVGTRARTASWSSNNYYYSGSGKGVTYINDNYPSGATFQDRVILFAQDMGVTHGEIVQFQNDMLE